MIQRILQFVYGSGEVIFGGVEHGLCHGNGCLCRVKRGLCHGDGCLCQDDAIPCAPKPFRVPVRCQSIRQVPIRIRCWRQPPVRRIAAPHLRHVPIAPVREQWRIHVADVAERRSIILSSSTSCNGNAAFAPAHCSEEGGSRFVVVRHYGGGDALPVGTFGRVAVRLQFVSVLLWRTRVGAVGAADVAPAILLFEDGLVVIGICFLGNVLHWLFR
mmetsp:Transcript_3518/g.7892  ORF Transcript_3518/g.7892 Transcript_3518/m.7892 type:complete len:215 (-) Transcript_3518:114-758(-)